MKRGGRGHKRTAARRFICAFPLRRFAASPLRRFAASPLRRFAAVR
ncbi:hypothetical protein C7S16_3180 [Burkholderia thailandensis]|uniref:Uncharacterized protein n=1 Tax=Burkholderia thailandensis TaxID=57975 RepID=A0AAW9CYP8_BURTH|nr:hypothetical protein [Burkholderia thailandensis]